MCAVRRISQLTDMFFPDGETAVIKVEPQAPEDSDWEQEEQETAEQGNTERCVSLQNVSPLGVPYYALAIFAGELTDGHKIQNFDTVPVSLFHWYFQ